ncbi:Histone-lysine N-methyltransferase SETMAR, partial [Stegodyphus mimosarum]
MLTAFFDIQVPLLLEFKEPYVPINARKLDNVHRKLDKPHKAIKSKSPGILSLGAIFLHDNARPHIPRVCVEALARKKWDVLEHPAYSFDLSPCDYHIFRTLKKRLMGQGF